jgi:hypothetical protein
MLNRNSDPASKNADPWEIGSGSTILFFKVRIGGIQKGLLMKNTLTANKETPKRQ